MNEFWMRHADPLVAGPVVAPGDRGTFDPLLVRVPGRTDVAPQSRGRNNRRPQRRRGRGGNRVHFGAQNFRFTNKGLLALAVAAAGAYLLVKKH
jgi:hypothetical protein